MPYAARFVSRLSRMGRFRPRIMPSQTRILQSSQSAWRDSCAPACLLRYSVSRTVWPWWRSVPFVVCLSRLGYIGVWRLAGDACATLCGGSLPSTVRRSIGAINMEVVTKCQTMYSSNGVPVPSLSVERTEAIQDRRLGLIQVRQPQHCFRNVPFCFPRLLLHHHRGPLDR
jgi:hypothetical protein